MTSNAWVIPAGGVHVADDENACDVTIMSFAAVVVTLGAACVRLLAVAAPFSTSTGFATSTPEKDCMPPAEPVDVLNVHE